MRPWAERTREEAHLLNPAFCCVIVTSACAGDRETTGLTLPFPLAFMILPVILHKHTRETLPNTTRTNLPSWLQKNTEVKLGFYNRLMALKPHTVEAIRYGLVFSWLSLGESGGVGCTTSNSILNKAIRSIEGESYDCVYHARFLGKWLGKNASTETTMALWGIRP